MDYMKKSYKIRKLNIDDVNQITNVHLDAFPDSTLTQIGKKCVKKYYEWQFTDIEKYNKLIYAFGIIEKDEIVAFKIFGNPRNAKIGFLKKNKFLLFKEVFKKLLTLTPHNIYTIIKTFIADYYADKNISVQDADKH